MKPFLSKLYLIDRCLEGKKKKAREVLSFVFHGGWWRKNEYLGKIHCQLGNKKKSSYNPSYVLTKLKKISLHDGIIYKMREGTSTAINFNT